MERLRHYYLEMVSSQRSFARMKLEEKALQKVARTTLEYYDRHAERFWEGTRDHDVSQNIASLLQNIEGEPPFTILDFGCGPGRDLNNAGRPSG